MSAPPAWAGWWTRSAGRTAATGIGHVGQTGGGKGAGLSTSAFGGLGADLSADHPAAILTGTSAEYPALAVDFDGNGEATWQSSDINPLGGLTARRVDAGGAT